VRDFGEPNRHISLTCFIFGVNETEYCISRPDSIWCLGLPKGVALELDRCLGFLGIRGHCAHGLLLLLIWELVGKPVINVAMVVTAT
jgi:hypothetical protein